MKAVITVVGRDSVGIIAKVSAICAEKNANIVDISQSVMKEYFAMIMVADIDMLSIPFTEFVDLLAGFGKERGLDCSVMHEDVFNSLQRI
jgi:ACT domain-containing protein